MGIWSKFKFLCYGIGAYKIGSFCYDVGSSIYTRNYRSPLNLTEKYGKCYAVVSGSTDGIGKSYAIELAKRGFNIVLIGRNSTKLTDLKSTIESQYGVKVETIQFDFMQSTNYDHFRDISKQLEKLDVGIVVNNVGVFAFQKFEDMKPEEINQILVTNIFATTYLTHVFAKRLLSRPIKSAIINIGSESGDLPTSYQSVYSASKAYDHHLSRSLALEYGKLLDIITVTPGPTATPMLLAVTKTDKSSNFLESFFTSTPDEVASRSLDAVGYDDEIAGTVAHEINLKWQAYFSPYSAYVKHTAMKKMYEKYAEKRS